MNQGRPKCFYVPAEIQIGDMVTEFDPDSDLKNAIMEMEIELQRQCDLIRALWEKLGDDDGGDGQQ